jgi:hypothetical protein
MSVTTPIVVDLGRTRDEQIDQLRSGSGQLVGDIEEVMRLVRLSAEAENGNRIFLPVVAIYTRAEDD